MLFKHMPSKHETKRHCCDIVIVVETMSRSKNDRNLSWYIRFYLIYSPLSNSFQWQKLTIPCKKMPTSRKTAMKSAHFVIIWTNQGDCRLSRYVLFLIIENFLHTYIINFETCQVIDPVKNLYEFLFGCTMIEHGSNISLTTNIHVMCFYRVRLAD